MGEEGCGVVSGGELEQWIEHFGRRNVQEFVAKRSDIRDVLTYLEAERSLELAKVVLFVTADSVRFQKRTSLPPNAEED